jgi:hypothetical protein
MTAQLQKTFEGMMQKAWPSVERGSAQWVDLQNAFFGGALVLMVALMEAGNTTDEEGFVILDRIKTELHHYSRTVDARADIFASIMGAGGIK